jgi:hypothetical protein
MNKSKVVVRVVEVVFVGVKIVVVVVVVEVGVVVVRIVVVVAVPDTTTSSFDGQLTPSIKVY